MKKILIILIISTGLVFFGFVRVYAEDSTQTVPSIANKSPQTLPLGLKNGKLSTTSGESKGSLQRTNNSLQSLQLRADTEIQRRITALNALSTRLGNIKRIPSAQIATLQAAIQSNIASLTALKAKIDADTDLTVLKTDVQSIVTDYRIFAFFMVDINLNVAADRMTNVLNDLTLISTKLQTRIQQAQTNGTDVTEMNSLLSDMNKNLDSAKTSLASIQTDLAALDVKDYPGNKSMLTSIRTRLKTVYAYFQAAHKDAVRIRELLVGQKNDFNSTGSAKTKIERVLPSTSPEAETATH